MCIVTVIFSSVFVVFTEFLNNFRWSNFYTPVNIEKHKSV